MLVRVQPGGASTRDDEGGPAVNVGWFDGGTRLRFGHQEDARGDCQCPAAADGPGHAATPRLAAVAVVHDAARGLVLLTRRPDTMRTFPGAWVLPGGGVDATDASVVAAALRELAEETGLAPAAGGLAGGPDPPAPLCLWESCYPPSQDAWRAARAAGARCSHHLIVHVRVAGDAGAARVALQPAEVDNAVWVPLADVAGLAAGRGLPPGAAYARAAGAPKGPPVPAAELDGVYPLPNAGGGIGRAHLFALAQLWRARGRARHERRAPRAREACPTLLDRVRRVSHAARHSGALFKLTPVEIFSRSIFTHWS